MGNYHLQWVKNSNVNTRTSVVHEHRNLIEVLRLAITHHQLDASNLQCLELAVRRLVQLEIAVIALMRLYRFGSVTGESDFRRWTSNNEEPG